MKIGFTIYETGLGQCVLFSLASVMTLTISKKCTLKLLTGLPIMIPVGPAYLQVTIAKGYNIHGLHTARQA